MKYKRFKFLLQKFIKFVLKFNIIDSTKIILAFFFKFGEIKIKPKNYIYDIYARSKTSDIRAIGQIFVNEDYNLDYKIKPMYIIDCGANVGYSTVYFANKFKKAKIIAVEPDPSNFKMLLKNTENYKNIIPYKTAIWDEKTFLKVTDIGKGNWGFIVKKAEENEQDKFEATTILDIIQENNFPRVDILKIDIEGTEKNIFLNEHYKKWLPFVNILIIEIHESYAPGIRAIINDIMTSNNYIKKVSNENDVWLKKQ